MENSFLNVSVQKRMFTVMNPLTDKKYQFINSKSSKKSDIQESLENYKINETISDKSIIIKDWINLDDTVQMVLNKIGVYCGDTIGNYVYAWYNKKPLAFTYKDDIDIETLNKNTKPDSKFYRDDVFNSSIYIDRRFNELISDVDDLEETIYFITLKDFMEENKSDEINYFNGIIRKYWVNIDDIKVIRGGIDIKPKFIEIKNTIKRVSQQISLIENTFLNNDDDINEMFLCKLIKLTNKKKKDNEVNIIKLFSDIRLSESIH